MTASRTVYRGTGNTKTATMSRSGFRPISYERSFYKEHFGTGPESIAPIVAPQIAFPSVTRKLSYGYQHMRANAGSRMVPVPGRSDLRKCVFGGGTSSLFRRYLRPVLIKVWVFIYILLGIYLFILSKIIIDNQNKLFCSYFLDGIKSKRKHLQPAVLFKLRLL